MKRSRRRGALARRGDSAASPDPSPRTHGRPNAHGKRTRGEGRPTGTRLRFHGPSRRPRADAGGRRPHGDLGDRAHRGRQPVCQAQPCGGRGGADEAGVQSPGRGPTPRLGMAPGNAGPRAGGAGCGTAPGAPRLTGRAVRGHLPTSPPDVQASDPRHQLAAGARPAPCPAKRPERRPFTDPALAPGSTGPFSAAAGTPSVSRGWRHAPPAAWPQASGRHPDCCTDPRGLPAAERCPACGRAAVPSQLPSP